MATAAEIADYDTEELERQLGDTRRELFNLRFQLATGQLDNYSRLNETRKNVARVLTVLRDREIALAEGRDAGPVILEPVMRPPRRRASTTDDDVEELGADEDEIDEVGVGEELGADVDDTEDEAPTDVDGDEEDE